MQFHPCFDIINIILSHIAPQHLIGYFDHTKLSYSIKFKYDAHFWNQSVSDINYLFVKFPNIILIGLKIEGLRGNDLEKIFVNIENLKYVILCGGKYFNYRNDEFDESDSTYSINKLQKCTKLTTLVITNLCIRSKQFYNPLRELTQLHTLRFINCRGTIQNSAMSKLTKLKHLMLANINFINFDIKLLFNYPKLKSFMIRGVLNNAILKNTNIGCKKLKYLFIGDSKKSIMFDTFSECTKLKQITLYGCHYQNIDILANNKNLRFLDLSWSKKLLSISFLKQCHKLQCLKMRGCHITDISPISECENLQYIDISKNTNIYDISVLERCPNLKIIRTFGCHNLIETQLPIFDDHDNPISPYNEYLTFPSKN